MMPGAAGIAVLTYRLRCPECRSRRTVVTFEAGKEPRLTECIACGEISQSKLYRIDRYFLNWIAEKGRGTPVHQCTEGHGV